MSSVDLIVDLLSLRVDELKLSDDERKRIILQVIDKVGIDNSKFISDEEIFQKILNFLEKNPNSSGSKICKNLGLDYQKTLSKLKYLEASNKIEKVGTTKTSSYKLVNTCKVIKTDKNIKECSNEILSVLRGKTTRQRILYCLKKGPCKLQDIKSEIDTSDTRLYHVLQDLLREGMITRSGKPKTKNRLYELNKHLG